MIFVIVLSYVDVTVTTDGLIPDEGHGVQVEAVVTGVIASPECIKPPRRRSPRAMDGPIAEG
jgi:hypothetical protein